MKGAQIKVERKRRNKNRKNEEEMKAERNNK